MPRLHLANDYTKEEAGNDKGMMEQFWAAQSLQSRYLKLFWFCRGCKRMEKS